MDARTLARYSLGVVRLVNGVAALAAPQVVARSLGADVRQPALAHVMRMFGIRTVFIGAELLLLKDPQRIAEALRTATVIHTSDTLSAATAGRCGTLPPRAAKIATTISAVNVLLSLLAQWPCGEARHGRC
ncbi:hypothetical protein [Streptomyces antimicrobicus]|uniref:Uncharacterized protein n=1 Tax=Streptomyces antimicrobicus TaxID=2883108 RepID=A0ABS8BAD2_9ACTN|nr:hypothetical protein [Streptomyces antimicrobicus]MCB5181559.1 hypothetical protein [Streptomyces antimicrobicus]